MDSLIPMAIALLIEAVKNPVKSKALKQKIAKVVRTVNEVFEGDEEFWNMVYRPEFKQ